METVGVVAMAALVVREATQMIVERFGVKARLWKVLISMAFTVVAAYAVHLTGFGAWSEDLIGAIWAGAWIAHLAKTWGDCAPPAE